MGWARAEARRALPAKKLLAWVAFVLPWPGVKLPCGGMGCCWEGGVWCQRTGLVLVNAGTMEEGQRPAGLGLAKGLCDGIGATPQLPKRSGVHAHLVGCSPSQQSSSMASLQDEESGNKPTQTHISLASIDLPFKWPLKGCSWPFGFNWRLLSLITPSLRWGWRWCGAEHRCRNPCSLTQP